MTLADDDLTWWLGGWAVMALTLCGGTACALRRPGLSLRGFHAEEDGAAYSLAYVMTFPVYVMFVMLTVEASLLIMAKTGSVYASYAAARNHVVYRSLEDRPTTEERSRVAAVRAMTPFASSSPLHQKGQNSVGASADADRYAAAVTKYRTGLPGGSAMQREQYLYADKATRVTIRKLDDKPNGDVEVTLTYDAPLHVPVVSRLLGTRSPDNYYVSRITTRVVLPDEEPRSETRDGNGNRTLGITYEPPR